MRTTTFIGFLAPTLAGVWGMEETVKISDLSIHKLGRHVAVDIDKMSFNLTGKDAQNLKCSAKNIAFPVPHDILPCGESKYSFALWPGEHGGQFRVMVHHDVGDSYVRSGLYHVCYSC
jgi:hypothetical protein